MAWLKSVHQNYHREACDEDESKLHINYEQCSHISEAVNLTKLKKRALKGILDLEKCKDCKGGKPQNVCVTPFNREDEIWLCLQCGYCGCGRYTSKTCRHARRHFKIPHFDSHAVVLGLSLADAWCYTCSNFVVDTVDSWILKDCVEFVMKHKNTKIPIHVMVNEVPARNKWKALKDKFRTTLSLIRKPKHDDYESTPYKGQSKYFAKLPFLKDTFTPRAFLGNVPKTNQDASIDEDSQENYSESMENITYTQSSSNFRSISPEYVTVYSVPNSPCSFSATTTLAEWPTKEDAVAVLLELENKKLKYLEEKGLKETGDDDDLEFFKSISPHIKGLSSVDKMTYRMKILQVTKEFIQKPNQVQVLDSSVAQTYEVP